MIRLANGLSEADISPHGAELRTWQVDGHTLLWSPDAAFWAETAPILFPVVGWTRGARVLVDGISHPLGLHGFAREQRFTTIEATCDSAVLRLTSDAATRALYPFDWSLDVTYALRGPAIETRLIVRNLGTRAMPYACGLHPGFRWFFAGGTKEDYEIRFAEPEAAVVPIISPDGLFTHETRAVPVEGRRLRLSDTLMAREALCFLGAKSRRLAFAHRDGTAIDITLEDFPHIALWSRPGAPFLSIEPWTGHGDFADAAGDLFEKPSMRHLAPGGTATHAATYAFSRP